ncbi:MAG: ribosome biogenesis GTP-binding protein YihA/YsxC [Pseudomonadota bacterium]|nr:ribosome biogenesis GTP-binding protein YihA/YsxC [Pseudomonadota bacterium]
MSAPPGVRDLEQEAIERGRRLFSGPVRFLMGVVSLEQLPPAFPVEIAFAGRSNVGKSSLLNALTARHNLARASNSPGRTRELNYFVFGNDDGLAAVDLPGYGYARVSRKLSGAWQRLVVDYLGSRRGLRRVFLLVDARRGLAAPDLELFDILDQAAVAYQIVLTKADKPRPIEVEEIAEATRKAIARRPAAHPHIHITSAEKGTGLAELRADIAALTVR